ncbi:MAG: hypothetical protein AB1414_16820 [bacterium]
MNLQKIIFLNKILFISVIVLIIYLGISAILIFTANDEYLKTSMPDKGIASIKCPPSHPSQPLSYYERLSSGRLFGTPVSTAPVITSSPSKVEEPTKEKPAVTAEPEITFQLIGITWGEEGANALIKSSMEPQSQLVSIGDKISGYEVVEITRETVILKKDKEKKVVELEY